MLKDTNSKKTNRKKWSSS